MLRLGLNIRDLEDGGRRVHREVQGRRVTILKHAGVVHALDTACYHMGGPLGVAGDVEDFHGTCVIKCPSHGHRISLVTGARVDTDLAGAPVCSAAGVQRIHTVVVDTDGDLRIVLKTAPARVPSDRYNEAAGPADRGAPPPPRGLGAFGPAAPPVRRADDDGRAPEPYAGVTKHEARSAGPPPPSPGAGTVSSLFRKARTVTAAAAAPVLDNAFAARGAAARAAVLSGGRHVAAPVLAPRQAPARPTGQASLTQFFAPQQRGSGGDGVEAMET